MTSFDVVAIPTKVADLVRSTMKAPGYGHPAFAEVATGHGPCRHCLRTFDVGADRRILFTYDPFRELGCGPLPGPIFVHAEPCERYDGGAGYPDQIRAHRVTLQAFARGRRLIVEEHIDDGRVEGVAGRLLDRDDVEYIHVRDTEAGCYDFRIERAVPAPATNLRK